MTTGLRPALPVLPAGSQPADRRAEGPDHGAACARTCATATGRSRSRPRTCSSGARCRPTRRSTFPNREALLDLYSEHREHAGRRAARAQPRDDRARGRRSGADPRSCRSSCSTRARSGCRSSARTRRSERSCRSSASKPDRCGWRSRSCRARACRFRSTTGRASSINGLEMLNRNNWFPAMTLIVGSPGETDEDIAATLDLIYEVERRGLFAFFIPSIFTPLHDTRLEQANGVTETRAAHAAAMAADDEVLEDEPAARPDQLVGADGVAARRPRPLGCGSCASSTGRTSPGRCSCSRARCRSR